MAKKPTPRKSAKAAAAKSSTKKKPAPAKKPAASKTAKKAKSATAKPKPSAVDDAKLKKALALEAKDAPKVKAPAVKAGAGKAKGVAAAAAAAPERNGDFPNTFIQQINVSLDDPDHNLTLTWSGPNAASQETGPFRSAPGAGMRGLNCDDTATSRRSGSKCTPKGTFTVEGFAAHLNSDARATFVTWFVQARGIACHFFPIVPTFAASHGCVRIEKLRIAQLIQSNSRAGVTKVAVTGTWTKPARQF